MLQYAEGPENPLMVIDGYIEVGHHKILMLHTSMWVQ